MQKSSGYGDRFGERLRAKATAFVSRSLRNTSIAVTELRSDNPEHGISAPLVREDAYLIGYHFVDYPIHEYFEDERTTPLTSLRAGQTTLYDLKRSPQFTINKACHCVHFYFPRSALNIIADNAEARRIHELRYQPGVGVDDPIIRALTSSLVPAFEHPDQASRIFVDHVTLAVGIHVAKMYGGMVSQIRPTRGGLAPWQLKRAEETLAASLQGDISLADLANDCGISASHFARAFRQSTGLSPHQWLQQKRVDEAKVLLRERRLSLSEIALACGFADQSHFTRVFSRLTGVSPGVWRRNLD
ncbi:AraC family transcriptional regulator [Bradyrhizobium sp. 31Argb]|uniref:helix-turn-helix domain-containing protein n=1 Tax=unclassified Bradyrhizobium TaxID=2631580 RepID=UPI00249E681E|nr:AraC family transcriptional regulator [Bradyrhizobium sp. Arg237L]MDI4232752.1 AraC family transcriptional regulator [Bradyrhizobium sp. Arg237L]